MMHHEIFPREVTANAPRITLTGRERLHVEQHRGLIAYSQEEIIFRTAAGLLKAEGAGMSFRLYNAGEALVSGRIDRVGFVQKEART